MRCATCPVTCAQSAPRNHAQCLSGRNPIPLAYQPLVHGLVRFPNTRPAMRRGINPSSCWLISVANTRLGFEQSDLRPDETSQSRDCSAGRRESCCNQPAPANSSRKRRIETTPTAARSPSHHGNRTGAASRSSRWRAIRVHAPGRRILRRDFLNGTSHSSRPASVNHCDW